MRRICLWLYCLLLCVSFPMVSHAGPLEDGAAAMKSGDYRRAYQLLYPLAEEGDAAAQDYIGTIFCEGLGVGMDERTAVSWYEKSAAQGYAKAQYALGVMYVNGRGVEKNEKKGISLITEAGQQGLVTAKQDAYGYYLKMAQDGNVVATHNVAYMCLKGWAGEVSPHKCVALLETAAKDGFAKSAYALSQVYSEGLYGVEKDEEKAAYWKDYADNLTETPAAE